MIIGFWLQWSINYIKVKMYREKQAGGVVFVTAYQSKIPKYRILING